MRKRKQILAGISCIFLLVFVLFMIYVNVYYKALPEIADLADRMERREEDLYFDGGSSVGFIIYPGGKVDERSYALLADMLHEEGFTAVIAKMPYRLSILNNYKAMSIQLENPEVKEWVIIGHSLGGTSASIYTHKYPENIRGLVFLASYPYKDLSDYDGFVISIRGSNDKVVNEAVSSKADRYMPLQAEYCVIEGGNHAGFGCYGAQKGDGVPEITWREQTKKTVEIILDAMNS